MNTPTPNDQIFHFDVDSEHNRRHNEYFRDTRRLQVSAVGLAVLLGAIGGSAVWRLGFQGIGGLIGVAFGVMTIVFIVVAAKIPSLVGSPAALYSSYPLVPAMVAKTPADGGLVLLGYVNTNIDPNESERRALTARPIGGLPGHALTVGERVPAVAVAGRRKAIGKESTTASEVALIPIAWGTPKKAEISRATDAVSAARWRKLKRELSRVDEVLDAPNGLMPL